MNEYTILTRETMPVDFFDNSRNVGFLGKGVNKSYLIEVQCIGGEWIEIPTANLMSISAYLNILDYTSAMPDKNVRFKRTE